MELSPFGIHASPMRGVSAAHDLTRARRPRRTRPLPQAGEVNFSLDPEV
jgi:hypothetical protein